MAQTLIIHHLKDKQLLVSRPDGKTGAQVCLTLPDEIQVPGPPKSNLLLDLRWCLERFLCYPFHPDTEVAQRVQNTLKTWGKNSFNALFAGLLIFVTSIAWSA